MRIDIRISAVSAEQQETITCDSGTIKANAVLWYQIEGPATSVMGVTEG